MDIKQKVLIIEHDIKTLSLKIENLSSIISALSERLNELKEHEETKKNNIKK